MLRTSEFAAASAAAFIERTAANSVFRARSVRAAIHSSPASDANAPRRINMKSTLVKLSLIASLLLAMTPAANAGYNFPTFKFPVFKFYTPKHKIYIPKHKFYFPKHKVYFPKHKFYFVKHKFHFPKHKFYHHKHKMKVVKGGHHHSGGNSGVVWSIIGCAAGTVTAAVFANYRFNRELTANEAMSCGLLFFFSPPN
jgi:hypothetical protein